MTITELLVGVILVTIASLAGLASFSLALSQGKSLESFTEQIADINELKLDIRGFRYQAGYTVPLFTNDTIYQDLASMTFGASTVYENFGPIMIGNTYQSKSTSGNKVTYTGIRRMALLKTKPLKNPVPFNIPDGSAVTLDSNNSTLNLPIAAAIPANTLFVNRPYVLSTLNGSFIVKFLASNANWLTLQTSGVYRITDTLTSRLPIAIVTAQASLRELEVLEMQIPDNVTDVYTLTNYDLYGAAGVTNSSRQFRAQVNNIGAEFSILNNWNNFSFGNSSKLEFKFDLIDKAFVGLVRKPVSVMMTF